MASHRQNRLCADRGPQRRDINRFSASVQNDNRQATEDELDANARLIQHAPDAYDVLRTVVAPYDGISSRPGLPAVVLRAREVLDKIDGDAK